MLDFVTIRINSHPISVRAGSSVAAAILSAENPCFRHSVTGEARAAICGMGICFECRVTIDGEAQQRSCLIDVREGMLIETA